jgi:hypothetical protein
MILKDIIQMHKDAEVTEKLWSPATNIHSQAVERLSDIQSLLIDILNFMDILVLSERLGKVNEIITITDRIYLNTGLKEEGPKWPFPYNLTDEDKQGE